MKTSIKLLLCSILLFGAASTTYAQEADNYVIQPQYSDIYHSNYDFTSFNEGVAWVELNKSGEAGVIDREGNLLFDGYYLNPQYFTTYVFSEGVSRARNDQGKWIYVNKAGKVVLETNYDLVLNFREGLAAVRKNGKWGFINRSGKEVVKPQYDDLRDDDGYGIDAGTSGFYEGLAAVMKNGKWGYIDKTGKEVVKPKYEWAFNFYEGMAVVVKNNKYGYINKSGKEVISVKYEDATSFSEGLARVFSVSSGNMYITFINKSGKVIAKLNTKYNYVSEISEGIAVATYSNSKYEKVFALLDKNGKVIVELGNKYENIKDFKEGLAQVTTKDGKYGYIDRTGKEVIKPIHKGGKGSSNGLIGVEVSNDLYGFLANPVDKPAKWATSEVEASQALDIIPLEIDYGYENEITRAEFSKLALKVLMTAQNKSMDQLLSEAKNKPDSSKINDTYDPEVLAAYSLGIIAGKGNNKLDPNGLITREEASSMIARIAPMLNIPDNSKGTTFADNVSIASWAKTSVAYVASIKEPTTNYSVMSTVGNNKFSPKSTFTKQQAFISMKRLFNATK